MHCGHIRPVPTAVPDQSDSSGPVLTNEIITPIHTFYRKKNVINNCKLSISLRVRSLLSPVIFELSSNKILREIHFYSITYLVQVAVFSRSASSELN